MLGVADLEHRVDRALELLLELAEQLEIAAEMTHVGARDLEIGLGADHLDLAEQVVEERPLRGHAAQALDAFGGAGRLRERGARAEPAGEHQADLSPAEAPRDRADAADPRRRARAIRGTRAEARLGQLVDRRRGAEEREQRLMLMYQIAVDAERGVAKLAPRRAERLHLLRAHRFGPLGELLEQRAGERDLEGSLRDREKAKLLGDDLALLGDLESAVHRAGRQRGERAIHRRSATASDASPSAVEQSKRDTGFGEQLRERLLPLVQRPRRGEDAGILSRIRVPDHHFLPVPARGELTPVDGILE